MDRCRRRRRSNPVVADPPARPGARSRVRAVGCQDVGVAAARIERARRPERAQDPELDEAGEPALGGPQLPIREERRELGRDDLAREHPQQQVLVAGRQRRPDGPHADRAKRVGFRPGRGSRHDSVSRPSSPCCHVCRSTARSDARSTARHVHDSPNHGRPSPQAARRGRRCAGEPRRPSRDAAPRAGRRR